jgi:hypothetical protein
MEHLTDSDWWWSVGLDGLGSTAIAAVIAVAGVMIALRNDRNLAWQNSFEADLREQLKLTRALRQACVARAAGEDTGYEVYLHLINWQVDLDHLAHRVSTVEPCLSAVLTAARKRTEGRWPGRPSDQQVVNDALQNAENTFNRRVSSPSLYKRMSRADCDEEVKAIRDGAVVWGGLK